MHPSLRLFAILGILFSTGQVLAKGAQSSEGIVKAYRSGQLGSVEEALGLLPVEMFRFPVIVPISSSNHQTSPENPRVILNSDDGLLTVAFTTLERAKDIKLLQFAQIDPNTGEPDFFQIDFSKPQAQPIRNPAECLACHTTASGRRTLRIEEYDRWGGWFGNDNYPESTSANPFAPWLDLEKQRIARFLAAKAGHPRLENFKHLQTVVDVARATHVGATRMNILSARNQALGVFQALRSMPDYEKFKYALATNNMYQLSDDLFDEYFKAKPKVDKKLAAARERAAIYLHDLFQKTDQVSYKDMHPLYEGLDLSLLEWLLERHGNSLRNFSTSGSPNYYYVSASILPELSFIDRLQDLTLQDIGKAIGEKAPRRYGISPQNRYLTDFYEGMDLTELGENQNKASLLSFLDLAKSHSCEKALGFNN